MFEFDMSIWFRNSLWDLEGDDYRRSRGADLRILNGRVSGDSLGRATFHGKAGISVVDYAICDQTLFSHILNFIVKEPTYLSDHSPLVTWLCTDTDIRNQDTSPESDTLTRLPKQFMWESDSTPKFKAAFQSPNLKMINSRIFKWQKFSYKC